LRKNPPCREACGASAVVLARVESHRLLTHPLILGCGAITVLSAVATSSTFDEDLLSYKYTLGAVLLPFTIGVMVVANLAISRSRRSGTDELFATMPVGLRDRTVGQLLALVAPIAVAAISQLVVVVVLRPWNGLATPDLPLRHGVVEAVTPGALSVLQGPVLVGVGGALGIALARWIPSALPAGVMAVGAYLSWVSILWWDWGWQRFLLPLAHDLRTGDSVDLGNGRFAVSVEGLAPAALAWHVVYLAGFGVLFAGLALLNGSPRRWAIWLTAGGLATVSLGAGMQVAAWHDWP
jgi:hypothetical protein